MKRKMMMLLCLLAGIGMQAQNLALSLDGKDNNVRTGIGIMEAPWTLEAWIKGDDAAWKETEVIFGGGEYSAFSMVDYLPLVVKQGHLYSTGSGLKGADWLDDAWHHVALSCDGKQVHMLCDGELIGTKDTAYAIIPGAIGVWEQAASVFGGLIDEVRVWNTCVEQPVLMDWMGRPVGREHPDMKHLVAYYNFDAGIDDTALNWMGAGYHAYHLRNGRVDFRGSAPLATVVENTNGAFVNYTGEQRLFNAMVVESEWDADRGQMGKQVMKLRVAVQGTKKPLQLEQLVLDLSGTTRLGDVAAVHVYATGSKARSTERRELFKGAPKRRMEINLAGDRRVKLKEGANYFLVTMDIKEKARMGNTLRAVVSEYTLSGETMVPTLPERVVPQLITTNSAMDGNCFRLLQWNIWHGGVHVPLLGRERIIELAKASKADIITMQEAYGFQKRFADAMGYHMVTASLSDNLSMFSRFPLEKMHTDKTFNSNPAIVDLGNGRTVLVDACWTRYAYDPEYTGSFPDVKHNPALWVQQDSLYPMVDAREMLENDIEPVVRERGVPATVIAGDFNSCSHLDWTERTRKLHAGWGAVPFPTSMYMLGEGYKDSFRELHPDEVAWPQGTFAGIYGQLDYSRIDFVYYKGGVKAINAKVVQTMPEIDDIWPSDHSALVTTFRYEKR